MQLLAKKHLPKKTTVPVVIRHISLGLVVLLALGVSAARSERSIDLPLDDELRDEIRAILDAGSGQIRKWDSSPSVVIIHRNDRAPGHGLDAIASIEEAGTNFVGFGPVTTFDLDAVGDDILGLVDLTLDNGDLLLTWTDGDAVGQLRGDIFVFALDLDELLLFGALTWLDHSFMRQIARSQTVSCFYSAWSRDDRMGFAAIYIPSSYPDPLIRSCMYEELIQSMGLLNDAVGSQTFTLNNSLIKPESNAADLALLDALYAPEIEIGAPADDVIRYLEERIDADLLVS